MAKGFVEAVDTNHREYKRKQIVRTSFECSRKCQISYFAYWLRRKCHTVQKFMTNTLAKTIHHKDDKARGNEANKDYPKGDFLRHQ